MRNKMNTETYYVKKGTPCMRNFMVGTKFGKPERDRWELWELFGGIDYDITNLKIDENNINQYKFELWDDEGFIGNYIVSRGDFEDNTVSKGTKWER
jgi:hypothetical protein